jgi:hypothetical protein
MLRKSKFVKFENFSVDLSVISRQYRIDKYVNLVNVEHSLSVASSVILDAPLRDRLTRFVKEEKTAISAPA